MQYISENTKNAFTASSRYIKARAELYRGSVLVNTFVPNDALKNITIDRIGEDGKFFGDCIVQKVTLVLIDKNRNINIEKQDELKVFIGVDAKSVTLTPAIVGRVIVGEAIVGADGTPSKIVYYGFPTFYVDEVTRNENNNEITIVGYDLIDKANKYTVNDLNLASPYTIQDVVEACATILGTTVPKYFGETVLSDNADNDYTSEIIPQYVEFAYDYPNGANFDGTEDVRSCLKWIAEATQTICYVNAKNELRFKRLEKTDDVSLNITKSNYFTLTTGDKRTLKTICNTTELGDSTSASIENDGVTQYIRDNPFLELREDINNIIENAKLNMCGISIKELDCKWRGNPCLEIGDKLSFITKDDNIVILYLLNDSIYYDGGLSENTKWVYSVDENESETTVTTISGVISKTYSKIDKANQRIDLVVSDTRENKDSISQLNINTSQISMDVSEYQNTLSSRLSNLQVNLDNISATVSEQMGDLSAQLSTKISPDQLKIMVQEAVADGVTSVSTTVGTFDEAGLTIEKSGSEMKTNINEDGMIVYRDNQEMLIANNVGVEARNLHANTYLIIGTKSRLEDFDGRTACFWIG